MATINPYLNFNGNCEEAFNFYKGVFGGDFLDLQRYKDAPPDDRLLESEIDWIMHVSLPIGDGDILMGSDSPSNIGKITIGNNFHISIQTEDNEETDRLYTGLSEGGQVTMPLQHTFWGARFGMFVDKFGVHWMINQDTGEGS